MLKTIVLYFLGYVSFYSALALFDYEAKHQQRLNIHSLDFLIFTLSMGKIAIKFHYFSTDER